MGGARALYRATKEFYLYGGLVGQGKPVIVLGAGNGGREPRARTGAVERMASRRPARRRPRQTRPRNPTATRCSARSANCRIWAEQLKTDTRSSRFRRLRWRRNGASRRCACAPASSAMVLPALTRAHARAGIPVAGASDRSRRPARPRSGEDRHAARRSTAARPRGDGDGRGRVDRLGVVPADPALRAGATRRVRSVRIRDVSAHRRTARALPGACRWCR